MSQPAILVTDAGRGSALSIIRSLGRRGWRVIAGDADAKSLGLRSRYAPGRLVYPSPVLRPADFVDSIIEAVSRWRVGLVIPVTDEAILPLSEERERLAGLCQVAMPDPDPLHVVTDKRRTLELAVELGIPAPRTKLVDSPRNALREVADLGWPLVLKPVSSRLYRDRRIEVFEVTYANHAEDLFVRLRQIEGRSQVLVQEFCPGSGCGVGLLMYEGRPLAAFQHKRLHEVPITGGASSLRESVPLDPVLYDYSVRILAALRWTGLAMVEYRLGPDGPKLMEVNGRVWGSLPLAVMSGVDFPGLLAELHLVAPPLGEVEPVRRYRVGVRARNLELEVLWIAAVLSGRRRYPFLPTPSRWDGLTGLLGLLNPRCRSDSLALDDLWPGVAQVPQILGKLWRKAQNRPGRPPSSASSKE